MRFKISKPPTAVTTERNPRIAMAQRAARVRSGYVDQVVGMKLHVSRQGTFDPLEWPGTARDVAWSSTPVFGRAPAGWYRMGFYA